MESNVRWKPVPFGLLVPFGFLLVRALTFGSVAVLLFLFKYIILFWLNGELPLNGLSSGYQLGNFPSHCAPKTPASHLPSSQGHLVRCLETFGCSRLE